MDENGEGPSSPGHAQYLQQQQDDAPRSDAGSGEDSSGYGPDPMGAFEKAPHMSQYANLGGLMNMSAPIQQKQQRQRSTPQVDRFLQSLMG